MYKDLKEVLEYLPQKIDEVNLSGLHRELAELYVQVRASRTPELEESISTKIEQIKEAQIAVQPINWDLMRLRAFEKFGGSGILGQNGFKVLNDQLADPSNEPNQVLQRFASEIENIKNKAQQALKDLEPLFEEGEEENLEGFKKLEVVFKNKVSIDTFEHLREQAKEWDLIIKNFQPLVTTPQEVRILSVHKSSPLNSILLANPEQINLILTAVELALQMAGLLIIMKENRIRVEETKYDTKFKKSILERLENEEKKELKRLIEEKAKELIKKSKKKLDQTAVNHATPGVITNVRNIYNFTVNGGNVNIVDGKLEEGDIEIEQSQFVPTYQKLQKAIETKKGIPILAEVQKKEIDSDEHNRSTTSQKSSKTSSARSINKAAGRPTKKTK